MMKIFLAFLIAFTSCFSFGSTKTILKADIIEGVVSTKELIGSKGHFEKNANGWNGFDDGAATSPVDGTGGTVTTTCTRSTSSPIDGDGSFLFTKGAANYQGEGCSLDFTIPANLSGIVLRGSFEYAISSGTYTDDAVQVWLYNVTDGTLSQPAPTKIKNHSLNKQTFDFDFQPTYGTTAKTWRVILHIAATDTNAYTIKIDNWKLGAYPKNYGSPITDLVAYTPTGSWTANSPVYTGYWKRVGDIMELELKVVCGGAPTAANLTINLPSGYSIDSAKYVLGQRVGETYVEDAGGKGYEGFAYINSSTSIGLSIQDAATAYSFSTSVSSTVPFTFGASDFATVKAKIPIVGWSSSAVMSSDADTRVNSLTVYRTDSSLTVTAGTPLELIFNTIETNGDTHGQYSTTTGRFTASTPGWYRYSANAYTAMGATAATNVGLYAMKNGTGSFYGYDYTDALTNSKTYTLKSTDKIYLNAGDYISIWAASTGQNVTVSHTGTSSHVSSFTVERISGPSQIMASETVAARYTLTSSTGNSSFADVTDEIIDFDSKDFDSHGAVTTGASWKFTAPISGTYRISSLTTWNSTTNLVGTLVKVYKNGSEDRRLGFGKTEDTVNGTTLIRLLAGEYINLILNQDDSGGAARAIFTGANSGRFSWIEIERVGNY